MKKVLLSVALAGAVSSLSAADLATNDAAFLFGHNDVNVVAMSDAEMVQTEGQLLEILNPVLGLVGGLPIVGPILDPLLGGLLGPVLGSAEGGLLAGLPVGPLLSSALPINVGVGVQAGTLLEVGAGLNVNSSLPTLLGSVGGGLL